MSSEPGVAHLGGKSDRPLGLREAATMCGCSETTIQRLIEIGLLPADGPRVADINGIRLILSFESAGISLDAFAVAARSGFLSLEFRRRLLADPIPLSKSTYREACRDLGLEESIATRLLVAAGLPEPEPDRVVREDDLLLLRLLADALALGVTEESGVRVLRVFGRTVRLQAEAMRDLFRHDVEAVTENQGRSPAAVMEVAAQRRLPLQQIGFELLELLSRRNLEDVVFENVTMRIQDAMATAGLALERTESDPAIAFIDISGFSRMTREVGDDEAARRGRPL
jgi:adenylate cyclase